MCSYVIQLALRRSGIMALYKQVPEIQKGVGGMLNGSKAFLKAAMLIAATAGLSGCVYDVGLGYASDSYYNDGYASGSYYDGGYGCDPYGRYDAYYDCDYRQGFGNIGFGGGWYDNYYYPGYGFILFDNVGRRYPMRDHHRSYWGERRHYHYREYRSRNRDGRGYDGRRRGYSNDVIPGVNGGSESIDGSVLNSEGTRRDRRREGRRSRIDQLQGGEGNGANAVPMPDPETLQGSVVSRIRPDSYGLRNRAADGMDTGSVLPQRAQQDIMTQPDVPAPRTIPAPQPERVAPVQPRDRTVGENVREE